MLELLQAQIGQLKAALTDLSGHLDGFAEFGALSAAELSDVLGRMLHGVRKATGRLRGTRKQPAPAPRLVPSAN